MKYIYIQLTTGLIIRYIKEDSTSTRGEDLVTIKDGWLTSIQNRDSGRRGHDIQIYKSSVVATWTANA